MVFKKLSCFFNSVQVWVGVRIACLDSLMLLNAGLLLLSVGAILQIVRSTGCLAKVPDMSLFAGRHSPATRCSSGTCSTASTWSGSSAVSGSATRPQISTHCTQQSGVSCFALPVILRRLALLFRSLKTLFESHL